ncbi:hypothetical protein [Micromonospora tulbaghiae]|uniref:hypothetical protein n=1 Tax=Micromonospora tulbaghiae TaxID=479978 RepID=UPI0034163820
MTSAPANLLAVRNLLLTYLNVDKDRVRADDLEPAEVGIVGDVNHRGGYHCGSNRVVTNDYSVVESSRDRAGLTLHASALDVGMFEVRSGGKVHNLRTFSAWMVAQCVANAADTRDIREVIYSPDGRTVRRWDRLGRRTSGDSSHLFHTHFSFFRDSTKAGRDQTPLFRRYLTTIGLMAAPTPEDDMTKDEVKAAVLEALREPQAFQSAGIGNANRGVTLSARTLLEYAWSDAKGAHLLAADGRDEQTIIAGVLAGLTPEKVAAAIPEAMAAQVADELAARLAA